MNNTFPTEGNLSGLSRKDFQKDINDKKTDLFILKNKKGMEVAVTNYGCAILSIMVPDKNGKYANVILGHDSIDHVINSPEPFLSTTIGRYGNRIAKGKFTLFGEEHELTINNGPNSLQKLVDAYPKILAGVQQRQAEAWQKTTEQWAADVKADKEIGGDKLISNLSAAQRALDQFGTPELKEYLNTPGLGNHPDLVKTFVKIGKAMSEDGMVTGGNEGQRSAAEVLYGK